MPTFRTVTNSRFSTPKKGGSFFKDKENRRWVIHIDWSEIMRITWDVSQTRLNYEWVSWHGNSRMILIRCHMCYTSSIYIYLLPFNDSHNCVHHDTLSHPPKRWLRIRGHDFFQHMEVAPSTFQVVQYYFYALYITIHIIWLYDVIWLDGLDVNHWHYRFTFHVSTVSRC